MLFVYSMVLLNLWLKFIFKGTLAYLVLGMYMFSPTRVHHAVYREYSTGSYNVNPLSSESFRWQSGSALKVKLHC